MSRRPHVISPETSLEEAQRLMQKYGYEGFPVVTNEKVVGLLTRRVVDKAVGHKLKLTAGSLMEAGNYTLKTSDSISDLQNLMSQTGWGQIAVVDPHSEKIIGIVTRTDLLKTLPTRSRLAISKKDYSKEISEVLSKARFSLLNLITNHSNEKRIALYIVGGFVRDILLRRTPTDFDIVVEGDALSFSQSLAEKYGGKVVSHHRFGTAKWNLDKNRMIMAGIPDSMDASKEDIPGTVDFISARTEFYDHPSALPTIERSTIKLDLHRRDFTINTLALRLDDGHYGELYDYWGGVTDIHEKQIRVLHSLSFVDDPTRLLRAVRFEQRFGFDIENRTLELMSQAKSLIRELSGERIKHELDMVFSEKEPGLILDRLQSLGLLAEIHPKLTWSPVFGTALNMLNLLKLETSSRLPIEVGNTPIDKVIPYLIWLASFDWKTALEIGNRLRLPGFILRTLEQCCAIWIDQYSLYRLAPGKFTLAMEKIPAYGLFAVCCLEPIIKDQLISFLEKWRYIKPASDGMTLQLLGIPRGPMFTDILTQIREARIDGIINTEQEESDYLTKLIKQYNE
jgi:tRNA nucleotidyltransferase (CCA-adding enzyme)